MPTETTQSMKLVSDFVTDYNRNLNQQFGKLEKTILYPVLTPQGKRCGLLAYNYEHPVVTVLFMFLKETFPDDKKLAEIAEEITSGKKWQYLESSKFKGKTPPEKFSNPDSYSPRKISKKQS